jgi:hypothetical protein
LRSGKSNTNGNTFSNRDANPYGNADSKSDTYSSCRTDTYSSAQANACTAARATYANAHCHGHAKPYPYTERYSQSDSAAPPFASTAPVTIYEKETHCSTPTSLREHAKNFDVRYS